MPTFQGLMSIALVFLIFNTIYSFATKEAPSVFKSEFFKWSLVLALIYLFGSIGTSYPDKAQFDVIQKSSVALIGFLLISGNLNHPSLLKRAKLTFILSNILALLICLVVGVIDFINTSEIAALFYTRLSLFLHPGYFSMYLCLSLAFLLYDLSQEKQILSNKTTTWIAVTFIFIGLYLLASKSGILTGILIILLFTFRAIRQSKFSRRLLSIIGLSFIGLLLLFVLLPSKSNRLKTLFSDFSKVENKKDYELNTAGQRMLIWQAASEVISDNFWIGTGVGNENAALKSEFEERGYLYLASKNLNAHNQFIQAFIALGITGFIFMLIYLLYPLWLGYKNKDYLLIAFAIIIIFNACTESILNRQAGVIFFTVWAVILSRNYSSTSKNPKELE